MNNNNNDNNHRNSQYKHNSHIIDRGSLKSIKPTTIYHRLLTGYNRIRCINCGKGSHKCKCDNPEHKNIIKLRDLNQYKLKNKLTNNARRYLLHTQGGRISISKCSISGLKRIEKNKHKRIIGLKNVRLTKKYRIRDNKIISFIKEIPIAQKYPIYTINKKGTAIKYKSEYINSAYYMGGKNNTFKNGVFMGSNVPIVLSGKIINELIADNLLLLNTRNGNLPADFFKNYILQQQQTLYKKGLSEIAHNLIQKEARLKDNMINRGIITE